ncbi:MAG: AAA family ATPase [Deltaproteobacteria bacterium]|nr:AAA family ATPase [Deltaproteobacteria bacterium]
MSLTAVIRGGSDQGMIVGVAGRNGAGKGEVIKLLEAKGYVAHSLSDAIRDVLRERGLEESRERMIETGRALRAEGGPGVLGERLAAKMDPAQDYAIDSVRHPAEVAALRASGQPFVLLWVDADLGVRFERIRARGRVGDPVTLDALRVLEARELGSDDPAAQQLDAVREIKDCVLLNDQGLDALSKALDDALAAAAGRVDSPASA